MVFNEQSSKIQLNIPYELFKGIVAEFLSNLSFNSEDKKLLDKISLNQILNASYIYGGSPKSSIFSNFLCPKNLYELLSHLMWRLNSSESITFLIKVPIDQKEISLNVDLQFFTSNILKRYSQKLSNYPSDITISEDNNEKLQRKSQIKLEETENLVYNVNKTCLGPLNYVQIKYELKLKLDKNQSLKENSEITKTLSLNNKDIIKEFTIDELYRNYKIKILREDITYGISVFIERVKDKSNFMEKNYNYYSIIFKFKNLSEYKIKNKKNTKGKRKISRVNVLKNSIFCPLITLYLSDNTILCKYNQQIDEMYDFVRKGDQNLIDKKFIENNEKLKYFSQINCVQTFSLKNKNCIYITPFGIFDNPREFPLEGPKIKNLTDFNSLKKKFDFFSSEEIDFLEKNTSFVFNKTFSELLVLLFKSLDLYFNKLGINDAVLWKFQWDNTQWRIKYLIKKYKALKNNVNYEQQSRIIKAPTGSGKTLIFFIDSILHYMFTGERIAIIFPTRILNIEMFQNLTLLIYSLRENELLYDCGLFIGTQSFKLTNLNVQGSRNNSSPLISICPNCMDTDSVKIQKRGIRKIGVCQNCGYEISYLYMPQEVPDYLPIINIATPDKLFYDALNTNYPFLSFRSFGCPVIKCPECGRYNSYLKKDVQLNVNNKTKFVCTLKYPECNGTIDPTKNKLECKPIGFIILDEIHSIYGFTGIILSIFFRFLKIFQTILGDKKFFLDFEAGTATIADEEKFFKALTTQEISSFPKDSEYFSIYFNYDKRKIRYRIVVQAVIFTSVRNAFSRAIIYDYKYTHFSDEIRNELIKLNYEPEGYKLLLGYLYRKSDGYTTSNSINAFAKEEQNIGKDLKPPIFISGDTSTDKVSEFLKYVNKNKITCFLANLIVSLGLNIKNLNNMILFAAPRSINEQVQTIGRLGRKNTPGHALILLMPNRPRDEFFYEHFHQILVDIKGYLEAQPIQATNIFISKMIIYNLIYSLMYAYMTKNYKFCFKNEWLDFLNKNINGINNYGLRVLFKLLFKILYVNNTEYSSLKDELKKIIHEKLRTTRNEFFRLNQCIWTRDYFKKKNKLLMGIRGTNDQIRVMIVEENPNFLESKSKRRLDTNYENYDKYDTIIEDN
ncbi:MAG: DEAD/DEAH box helicase [Promethearchaeota archaeon]